MPINIKVTEKKQMPFSGIVVKPHDRNPFAHLTIGQINKIGEGTYTLKKYKNVIWRVDGFGTDNSTFKIQAYRPTLVSAVNGILSTNFNFYETKNELIKEFSEKISQYEQSKKSEPLNRFRINLLDISDRRPTSLVSPVDSDEDHELGNFISQEKIGKIKQRFQFLGNTKSNEEKTVEKPQSNIELGNK